MFRRFWVFPICTWMVAGSVQAETLRVRKAESPGPEAGLAVDGPYGRGLALEAAGQHEEAIIAYGLALAALDGMPKSRKVRAWRDKLEWELGGAQDVLEQMAYARIMPGAVEVRYELARALHGKVLAVRAVTGRAPAALWTRAKNEYLAVLAMDPHFAL